MQAKRIRIDNFYTAFGYLTCEFAEMEGDLRRLIAGLAFGDDSVTACAFLDSSQLAENTRTLRKLARQHWEHEASMLAIVEEIDRVRPTRNLFIHGLWSPGTLGTPGGSATVRDLNSAYEKTATSREWVRGKERSFTIKEFNELIGAVHRITAMIEALCTELEKNDDYNFSHFGSTSMGKPTRFAINADGSLGQAMED